MRMAMLDVVISRTVVVPPRSSPFLRQNDMNRAPDRNKGRRKEACSRAPGSALLRPAISTKASSLASRWPLALALMHALLHRTPGLAPAAQARAEDSSHSLRRSYS